MPIVNNTVNAVAMTVLPDAPIDPATGLQVPTIAVATNGGVSVIQHNGTVRNLSIANNVNSDVAFNGDTLYVAGVPSSNLGIFSTTNVNNSTISVSNYFAFFGLAQFDMTGVNERPQFEYARSTKTLASRPSNGGFRLLRENSGLGARSVAARVDNTFNTGWKIGDTRRCYLADVDAGSVAGAEISKGQNVVDLSGWVIPAWYSVTAVGGNRVRLEVISAPGGGTAVPYFDTAPVVVGSTYRVEFVITGLGASNSAFLSGVHGGAGQAWGNAYPGAGTSAYSVRATGEGNGRFRTSIGAARVASTSNAQVGDWVELSLISAQVAVTDRSYKNSTAVITGTLTKTPVATGAQLVAYSGFSAANYLREPYSTDLDFGTGEWTANAWINTVDAAPANTLTYSAPTSAQPTVWTLTGCTEGQVNSYLGTNTAVLLGSAGASVLRAGASGQFPFKSYLSFLVNGTTETLTFAPSDASVGPQTITLNLGTSQFTYSGNGLFSSGSVASFAGNWKLVTLYSSNTTSGSRNFAISSSATTTLVDAFQVQTNATRVAYYPTTATAFTSLITPVADRSAAGGPAFRLGIDFQGRLTAIAFDGTTTRTVTTTAAYNTATWLKARANYRAGRLSILVNGIEVAATNGAPLLTLSNAAAVLTIGNSFNLDAPFPGSIALLKFSATVPTAEQALWMYEQEKQMFRDGAQVCLPDAGAIVDLAYDDATDKWIAVSATNESEWSGLVRTSVTPSPAGSYSRVAANSGIQLLARTTTSPGVDVTIPAYGLREELVKRAEAVARANKDAVAFNFDTVSFTAAMTSGSNQVTASAITGTPFVGMAVTGTGLPAGTTIHGINGTTYALSANATATGSNTVGQSGFDLPPGFTARVVYSVGLQRREGATRDYIRQFDGFRERVLFAVTPGASAWVQIHAVKE